MILDKLFARAVVTDPRKSQSPGILFGRPTAGIVVDEERALQYNAVWACVKVIAETLSIVSWQVFERQEGFRQRLFDVPLARLLNVEPNPEMTPLAFKQALAAQTILWGNGYAEISRNRRGDPTALWPIHPSRVEIKRDERNEIVYEVRGENEKPTVLPAENMFAPIGLSFDGISGLSPIRMARESVSMGLAMERFGAAFFGNDARPSVVLKHPGQLSQQARQNLQESFSQRHGGSSNSWKPMVAEEGMDIATIGMPPEDAQYIETKKHQIEDIARWFRVPPHKIQHMERATFNNIDSREREFITEAVLPWARGFEEEANRKLVSSAQRNRVFTKFNLNSLMRGDVKTRGEFYNTMFNVGAYSPNDIRSLEDQNPVQGGNVRMVPGNMVTLNQAGSQMAPTRAMHDVFEDVASRMLRKQYKAVSRAAQKPGFQKWLHDFYAGHRDEMIESFEAPVKSLASCCEVEPPKGLLARQVTEHCQQAVETIGKSDDPEASIEWWTRQPNSLATQIIDGISDALTTPG